MRACSGADTDPQDGVNDQIIFLLINTKISLKLKKLGSYETALRTKLPISHLSLEYRLIN